MVNITKKGYDIIKEELSSNPTKRQRAPVTYSGETSARTDLVVTPSKKSWWGKTFDDFREKVNELQFFGNRIAYVNFPLIYLLYIFF